MINIFLVLIVMAIWPLLYFIQRNNVKPRQNIILGVTLPQSSHKESETEAICKSFKKWLNIVMLPLLLLLIPAFFIQLMGALLTWCMTWLLLVIAASTAVFARYRSKLLALKHAKNRLSKADGLELADSDEDQYWLWGILYHNSNNKRLLVKNRAGINMSVNLARPAGKVVFAFMVLCILAMPFFGIWIWIEELTPTRLILSETSLTARHTRDSYIIQLDTIESVELIETLPSMLRVGGTGLENLKKGIFRVESYGMSRVCIQPKDPPFLVIQSGGKIYIINDANSKVTREIYSFLR